MRKRSPKFDPEPYTYRNTWKAGSLTRGNGTLRPELSRGFLQKKNNQTSKDLEGTMKIRGTEAQQTRIDIEDWK